MLITTDATEEAVVDALTVLAPEAVVVDVVLMLLLLLLLMLLLLETGVTLDSVRDGRSDLLLFEILEDDVFDPLRDDDVVDVDDEPLLLLLTF